LASKGKLVNLDGLVFWCFSENSYFNKLEVTSGNYFEMVIVRCFAKLSE